MHIRWRADDYTGMSLAHCHIISHADTGMSLTFEIYNQTDTDTYTHTQYPNPDPLSSVPLPPSPLSPSASGSPYTHIHTDTQTETEVVEGGEGRIIGVHDHGHA